jgi:hypothetical protein
MANHNQGSRTFLAIVLGGIVLALVIAALFMYGHKGDKGVKVEQPATEQPAEQPAPPPAAEAPMVPETPPAAEAPMAPETPPAAETPMAPETPPAAPETPAPQNP